MNILLLGSGGRESALAWKMSQSKLTNNLFIAPGNGGTAAYGTNVAISPLNFDEVNAFVNEHQIDLLVVGNEDPLVAGITDYFRTAQPQLLVVGPERAGAMLEGSKDFAKQFMVENNIPTARHHQRGLQLP
jgi:phosphoribosylamine--glycine ligase